MGLMDTIAVEQSHPYHDRGCSVRQVLAGLPDSDASDLLDALADETITSAAISRGLAANNNVTLNAGTLRRHRTGGCKCGEL